MKTIHLTTIILAGIVTAITNTAFAHDPGLSYATVQLLPREIRLQLTFSQKDIESLIFMRRSTTDVSTELGINQLEINKAKPALVKLITDGIDLRIDNKQNTAIQASILPTANDTVSVSLRYPYRTLGKLDLRLPIIAKFPRGHRLYLSVRSHEGEQTIQKILKAGSAAVLINNTMLSGSEILKEYFTEGIWHIWIGFDHILFLLTLLLPAVLVLRNRQWQCVNKMMPALKDTMKIVTAFTIAHSITLGMAVFDIVQPPVNLIEVVIACSVLLTALNNLRPTFASSRWILAFVFGLIHGFGFANALTELGLPANALLWSLVGFNLGVEAGQLAIVAVLIPVAFYIRYSTVYQQMIFKGGSAVAAMIATVWMFERLSG